MISMRKEYKFIGDKTEQKAEKCFICNNIIEGTHITYYPKGDILCSNACLIKYRNL